MKTHRRSLAAIALVIGLLSGCGEKKEIAGFDNEAWKKDYGSCRDTRRALLADFEKVKEQFFGMSEREVKKVLGRPDGEELFDRNQRYFYYYIEPGSHCNTKGQLSEANRLQIRFSPLSKVNEITFSQPVK